jgi:peptide/nickel transport system substrate-binding protein
MATVVNNAGITKRRKGMERKKGIVRMLILMIILFGLWISPMSWAKEPEGVVNVGTYSPINAIDPAFAILAHETLFTRNIFQGLVRYKFNSLEIEGDLAKSWAMSKDGMVYTFKLRDNILWHKGFGKVTAQDVKFSYDRILDPQTRSRFAGEWKQEVKELKVIDDLTVEFHLVRSSAVFLHMCVRPRPLGIVCKKAVEKYGKDFGRNPIGSGPYVFQSMSREQIVITANREYWEGPPRIDKFIYRVIPDVDTLNLAMEKGEVDLMWDAPRDKSVYDRFRAAGVRLKKVEKGTWNFLLVNPKCKPLADVRVRRAIAQAIDKDTISEHVLAGTAEKLGSLVPKGYFGHTEEGIPKYEYNPQKAKELLAEAGYGNGFEVTLDTFQSPSYLPIAMAIQGQLKKVGIEVKLAVTDQVTWLKKVSSATTEMSLYLPIRAPDADFPLTSFHHSAGNPPGSNLFQYNKLDKAIDEARGEMDSNKRLKMYHEIQKKLMEDLPAIPLFMFLYIFEHRADLTGLPDKDPVWGLDFYHLYYEKKK